MKRVLVCLVSLVLLQAAAASAQVPDTLGRIRAAKAINVGYSPDSLPFSVDGTDGKPAGFSIDLCNRIIAAIGRAVDEPNLKVNWVPGTVAERLQMVQSGKLDLECANTTRTLTRMKSVDFSSLVFIDSGGIMVRQESTVRSFGDLNGKRIAVIKGTTTEQRLNATLKARLIRADVIAVRDANEGLTRLESGFADAFASDKIKLVGVAVQSAAPEKIVFLGEDLSFEPYAFALPRGDAALRWEVDRALTQVYTSPEIDRIFDKWLGKLGKPTGLLSAVYVLNAIPE
jgi:ABC-type amino acid transport substrate-binding protein